MLLMCCTCFVACDDDDDNSGTPSNQPSEVTLKAFQKDYPNATNVVWRVARGYNVAQFNLQQSRDEMVVRNHAAYYPINSAKKAYTEVDLTWEQLRTEAPQVVAAWEAGEFAASVSTDRIDVEKKAYFEQEARYELEFDHNGTEYELLYALDGTLLKTDIDAEDDDEGPCPFGIIEFIQAHYPNAYIDDYDQELIKDILYETVEIEVRENGKKVEYDVVFKQGVYVISAQEIDEDDYNDEQILPKVIVDALTQINADRETWDEVYAAYNLEGKKLNYYAVFEIEGEEDSLYEISLAGDAKFIMHI